jgi:putative MATE family efflux protein
VLLPLALLGSWPFRALAIAAEMVPAATTYWVIRIAGAAPFFLSRAQESYFRGIGDTKTPMVVAVVANLLNVVLDAAFVLGFAPLRIPALGVAGLAWATVAATALQWLALGLASEARRARGLPAALHFRRSRLSDLRDLLRVGAPAGVHWLLDVAAWAVFTIGIARLEAAQAATNVIAITLIRASFMPGFAVGTAAQTLVGQYLGAGDPGSAARSGWTSVRIACIYMCALGVVFLLFGRQLFGLFTPDPRVRDLGAAVMRWAAVFQLGDAVQVVLAAALRGAGDTRFVMAVASGAAWVVFVPLSWWLGHRLGMGVEGGWLACVAWVAAMAVPLVLRFRGTKWRQSLVHPEEPRPHPEGEVA